MPLVPAARGRQAHVLPILMEFTMPVPIPPPTELTKAMCDRLKPYSDSPADHRSDCNALSALLFSIRNLPAPLRLPAPTAPDTPMADIYLKLATPAPGSARDELSPIDEQILFRIRYLREVEIAPRLSADANPAEPRPQSQIHAHVLHELRRELGLLGVSVAAHWVEAAISELAPQVLEAALAQRFQPTEVRVRGAEGLPPVAGRHRGGLRLWLAAWNGAMTGQPAATSAGPNAGDPNNPLANGQALPADALRIELVWTDNLHP